MNTKKTFSLRAVKEKVGQHEVAIGFINSGDFIDLIDNTMIPSYQRDRVLSKKKIESLQQVYKEYRLLDAVILCIRGDTIYEDGSLLVDSGDVSIVDGQQRLLALKDSGVKDYKLPALILINVDEDSEIDVFHQVNGLSTRLKFGEQAKSWKGPMAAVLQEALNATDFPINITTEDPKLGIRLQSLATLMFWAYKKMTVGSRMEADNVGKIYLRDFLQNPEVSPQDAAYVGLMIKRLLANYVALAGSFDRKSKRYNGFLFMVVCHVFIDFFMDFETGEMDFGRFEKQAADVFSKFLNKSTVLDIFENGNGGHHPAKRMYAALVDFLNTHKSAKYRLQLVEQPVDEAIVEEGEETITPINQDYNHNTDRQMMRGLQ